MILPEPDRIPTSTSKFEGFSFLYGQSGRITFDLWRKKSVDHSLNSTLTFTSSAQNSYAVTLPLANTLFKTGKRSMLQASRWKLDSEENLVKVCHFIVYHIVRELDSKTSNKSHR
jgi:hypothetical protein